MLKKSLPLLLLFWAAAVWAGPLTVVFIDCGKGDAALIETPAGKNVLVDAGAGKTPTAWERRRDTVTPFLKKRGVKKLDVLILTHPHPDHIGGARAVVRAFRPERVYESGEAFDSTEGREFNRFLEKQGVAWSFVAAGSALEMDPSLRCPVLWPPAERFGGSLNDQSLVFKIIHEQVTFLFTGDVEADAEKALADQAGESLESLVLKVPHHGYDTSSTAVFLKNIRPRVAVISTGEGRRPEKAVLERLSRAGARVYRTDKNGTVSVISDGRRWDIETQR